MDWLGIRVKLKTDDEYITASFKGALWTLGENLPSEWSSKQCTYSSTPGGRSSDQRGKHTHVPGLWQLD